MSVFADRNPQSNWVICRLFENMSRSAGPWSHWETWPGGICFQAQDFLDIASGQDQASPKLSSQIPDGFLFLSCSASCRWPWSGFVRPVALKHMPAKVPKNNTEKSDLKGNALYPCPGFWVCPALTSLPTYQVRVKQSVEKDLANWRPLCKH